MTLFIVEDDRIQSLILEMMVDKLGHKLIGTEESGKNAVDKILDLRPDIILLDVMLKDSLSGIDVAQKVKSSYDPVIIYITGNSDKAHKELARQIGYHDFITKPVSYKELRNSIDEIEYCANSFL